MRNLLSESIYNFERGMSKDTLDIGMKTKIFKWLKENEIYNYIINTNLTIDTFGDVNLINKNLYELPKFIKFNHVYGNFYAADNYFITLEGFPNIIGKDFQIRSNYGSKFSEKYINKKIKVYGNIWN